MYMFANAKGFAIRGLSPSHLYNAENFGVETIASEIVRNFSNSFTMLNAFNLGPLQRAQLQASLEALVCRLAWCLQVFHLLLDSCGEFKVL